MKYIKKLLLFTIFGSLCFNAQASFMPQWVSNCSQFISSKTAKYIGIGALTLASAGCVGYYIYKNYFSKKPAQNPLENLGGQPSNSENYFAVQQIQPPAQPDTALETDYSGMPFIDDNKDDAWGEKELTIKQPATPIQPSKHHNDIFDYSTFEAWDNACHEKLHVPDGSFYDHVDEEERVLSYKEFDTALTRYLTMLNKDSYFQNEDNWVDYTIPYQLINSLQKGAVPVFEPYVQKVVLPAGSIIAFHGDIHGDVHSLNEFIEKLQGRYLDGFTITDPQFYMAFLGDYTDRGLYGAEVIYTILRLKCANPQQVLLVRGNHEDIKLNQQYGFYKELQQKFTNPKSLLEKIEKMYETLPLALYLGCGTEKHTDYILCCHGGVELGFDPHALLNYPANVAFTKLGILDRPGQLKLILKNKNIRTLFQDVNTRMNSPKIIKTVLCNEDMPHVEDPRIPKAHLVSFNPEGILTRVTESNKGPIAIGFQWNDYLVPTQDEYDTFSPKFVEFIKYRGWKIGRTFNKAILQLHSDRDYTIQGVFRAHQHSDAEMVNCILHNPSDHECNHGVGRLWIEELPEHPQQLWNNIVCTFSVCPHTPYQQQGFVRDTYGLLTVAEQFEDWRLQVIQ